MFLKAGLVAMALLVASRLLGLVRESALAAAFGTSALADAAVLLLSLPDLLTSLFVAGALSYVLLPVWAAQTPAVRAVVQRRVAQVLLASGLAMAAGVVLAAVPLARVLLPGLAGPQAPAESAALARSALLWAALALPASLLAALWSTRLQHERDFAGLYGANLVVNAVAIAAVAVVAMAAPAHGLRTVAGLGLGLALAAVLRLAWLHRRMRRTHIAPGVGAGTPGEAAPAVQWPPARVWVWAALAAGLPLALPFVARSIASAAGEGQLATFGYAWKLVELPQMLAIQLVATLALPGIARALASDTRRASTEPPAAMPVRTSEHGPQHAPADDGSSKASARTPADAAAPVVRQAFALAFVLGVAAQAGLMVAGPALAELLFGWGRMLPSAVRELGRWGAIGAWCLPPMALLAVAAAVLAAQRRMAALVLALGLALGVLLAVAWGAQPPPDGRRLMALLAVLHMAAALVAVLATGALRARWLPWSAIATATLVLTPVLLWSAMGGVPPLGAAGLAGGGIAAALVLLLSLAGSQDLRDALRR